MSSSASASTIKREIPDSEMAAIEPSSQETITAVHTVNGIFPSASGKSAVPLPNKMYMITDEKFKHALAVQDAQLKFIDLATANYRMGACWLWKCEEIEDWLAFRNGVSRTYLGLAEGIGHYSMFLDVHDRCKEGDYRALYRLFIRPADSGKGYLLSVKCGDHLKPIKMCGSGNGAKFCVMTNFSEQMLWGFIEV
ncbi:hypothetical protein QBC43DRAFT_312685 [Cladorrhinum sp. PSN259]|nr:hypothetical protein QBC43DRAFT_312685 [Cladorrhinum sp. PSN259]